MESNPPARLELRQARAAPVPGGMPEKPKGWILMQTEFAKGKLEACPSSLWLWQISTRFQPGVF